MGYRLVLFVVAPAFYVFSRALVQPTGPGGNGLSVGVHALPLALALLLPATWAMPIAFALGAGYLVWLTRTLYWLRAQRSAFVVEMALLGTAFALATAVVVMGSMPGILPRLFFVSLYAGAIGLALLLVQLSLTWRPSLPAEVRETAQAAYAATTLARVDCDAAVAKLEASLAEQHRKFKRPPKPDDQTAASQDGTSAAVRSWLPRPFGPYRRFPWGSLGLDLRSRS